MRGEKGRGGEGEEGCGRIILNRNILYVTSNIFKNIY